MRSLLPVAALAIGSVATGQTFFDLGTGVLGSRMSSDGEFVAGSAGGSGFIWSSSMGLVDIGEDSASSVTTDGTRAFGKTLDPFVIKDSAGHWDVGTGSWTSMGGLSGSGCDAFYSVAIDSSGDGTTAAVNAWLGCTLRACTWTQATGVVALPNLGSLSNRANVMSDDGSTVGGMDRGNVGTEFATIWINGGAPILVNVTPSNPTGVGEVYGLSSSGRYATGTGYYNGTGGFIYDVVTGVNTQIPRAGTPLPDDRMRLYGVADDGKTAVGYQGQTFFGSPLQAVIWTESGGSQFLSTFLASKGINLGPGPLYAARDLSADGRSMIVSKPSSFGFENQTFVVHLAELVMDLGGSTTGIAGNPVLSATGTFNPGTNVDMSLENVGANFVTVLIISGASIPVPLFGGTLHTFPVGLTSGIFADANGEWDISFNWPANINPGKSLWFQVASLFDPVPIDGIALSNGLKITTP